MRINTDPIWGWKLWHTIKWITGAIILATLLWLIWNVNSNPNFEKELFQWTMRK